MTEVIEVAGSTETLLVTVADSTETVTIPSTAEIIEVAGRTGPQGATGDTGPAGAGLDSVVAPLDLTGSVLSILTGTGGVALDSSLSAYALLAGATFTGNVSVTKASASSTVSSSSGNATLTVNRAAGNYGFLNFNTANSARWSLFSQNAAEGGSNAGSDLALFRYNDAGAFLGSVLSISRATGAASWTGTTTITPVAAVDLGLILKGQTSQSGNLLAFQDSAGTVLSRFNYNGDFIGSGKLLTATGAAPYLQLNPTTLSMVNSGTTSNVVTTIKGMAAQSGNLTEWQNSAGSILALVSTNGYVVATGFQSNDSQGLAYSGNSNIAHLQTKSTGLLAQTSTAANIALTIKNAHATPTGNLTEWHSTAGSILAKIDASGNATVAAMSAANYSAAAGGAGLYCSNSSTWASFRVPDTGPVARTDLAGNVALTVANVNASPTAKLTSWTANAAEVASVSAAGLGTFAGVTSSGLVATPAATTTTAGLRLPPGTTPTSPVSGDVWMTSGSGVLWRNGAATRTAAALEGAQTFTGAKTFGALVTTAASTTTTAGLNLPAGAAPTSPIDGDTWTTTAGMYVRINGSTVGPLAAAGAGSTPAFATFAKFTRG